MIREQWRSRENGAYSISMTDRWVVPIAALGSGDLPIAGGKGANLGALTAAGFPVPNGFVVTTAAYDAAITAAGMNDLIAGGLSPDVADGQQLREAIRRLSLPADLRQAVVEQYLALGAGPVAVRSSATAEDLPGAAFAGQQDTFLDVAGEESVLEAVTACWASLWTDRALAYRRRQHIAATEVSIAVVVQRMVPADAAGVMFTANPLTGRRDEIVVDATAGLGEAVVSGTVTPEHYVLDRTGRCREWTPGQGGADGERHRSSGSTTADDGSPGMLLSPTTRSTLADLAVQATELFGVPQDMEWALADNVVWIVQARPMTALPPAPRRLNLFQRRISPFYLEMFHQRPLPLDVSGWIEHGVAVMLRGMTGSVGVRFPPLPEWLPQEDGLVTELVPPWPRPTWGVLGAPRSIRRRVRRYHPATWTADPRFPALVGSMRRLAAEDLRTRTWAQLLSLVEEVFETTKLLTGLRVDYLPAAFVAQLRLQVLLLLLRRRRLASALVAGAVSRTSQANAALEGLAEHLRADDHLRGIVQSLPAAELLPRLRTDPAAVPFLTAFDAFLAEYGHRETVSVVLTSPPTWSDAPEVVLGLVQVLLAEPTARVDQSGEALGELLRHPLLRIRRLHKRAAATVQDARIGLATREDTHFYLTLGLPPLRRAFLECGRRLHLAGVLTQPSDVFYLQLAELQSIGDPAALPEEQRRQYRALVRRRVLRTEQLRHVPLLNPESLLAERPIPAGVLLTGTPASRGVATGAARIIAGPAEFASLRGGEVLVCPYTNPSWTPLFQRACAVVVDTGGLGSHAAIVAREYGIPAVMGTGTGTTTLAPGQRITVDGDQGIVVADSSGD